MSALSVQKYAHRDAFKLFLQNKIASQLKLLCDFRATLRTWRLVVLVVGSPVSPSSSEALQWGGVGVGRALKIIKHKFLFL